MIFRHLAFLFTCLFCYCQADITFNMPILDAPLSFNQTSFPLESSVMLVCNELTFYALLLQAQSKELHKDVGTKIGELLSIWATKQLMGLFGVIMHELGHAATSKGSTFYTLKNVEIHYSLLSLFTGAYAGKTYSTYWLESAKLSRFHIENIIHCFAGPVAGITSIYLMYSYLVPSFVKKMLTEYKKEETPLALYFLLSLLAPHIASSLPSMGLHFSSDPTDFDQAYNSFNVLLQTT